jgi:AraC-like DNA-binding protein
MPGSANFTERNCHTGFDVTISGREETFFVTMENRSISVYFVQSALAPLMARGIDVADLLRTAGIAPALLQSPEGRVSPESFSALWLGVARLLDDELFGQDSRRMKVGTFAMLCRTLIHCATLSAALHRMALFFNLVLDDFHCSLESDAQHGYLTIRGKAGAGQLPMFGYETLLIMQHGLACWLVGRRIPILRASFAYPDPPVSAEYRRMFSEQMSFNEDATRLAFKRSYLDLPVIQDRRTVEEFLRGAPGNIVLKYKNSTGLSAQIRRSLRSSARTGWPDFNVIAAKLHMTPSTLRRRLGEEGQSFQAIKDQLRRDMAIDALSRTSSSVAVIAADLGFAEASAFHRAFKKWTGVNPGEYRDRILQRG